jgi:hypothetical protein
MQFIEYRLIIREFTDGKANIPIVIDAENKVVILNIKFIGQEFTFLYPA